MKDIFSHAEMTLKEGIPLQRGMNFRPAKKRYSIFLMSASSNSPYNDGFAEDGKTLSYEGEDVTRREKPIPKKHNQPFFTKTGKLTNNGKFFQAAEDYRLKRRKKPEKIKVYEKISRNVWSDKGFFHLIETEYKYLKKEDRKVFKFILRPISDSHSLDADEMEEFEFSRRIPTDIKRTVWERDNGKCKICPSTENLHFDHIIPFSKGGSSVNPKNIQILCGKHNLQKSDKII